MPTSACLLRRTIWLIVCGGTSLTCFGRNALTVLPVPADSLELVTGHVQTPHNREAALNLLEHASDNFGLRGAEEAYDLKVNFTVDSLGQTDYDGSWEMEDLNVPGEGLHWTAKSTAGYAVNRISSPAGIYAEATSSSLLPLRLHEARGLFNNPLPSPAYASRGSIRTATATYHGATLTCLLLSRSRNPANPPLGRGWEEAEECIDPASGLLQVHSEVPGRYIVYDYTNPFVLGDHVVPRNITVTEAGRIVSKISVESVTRPAGADQSLFVPTDAMKAAGPPIVITGAERISRTHRQGRSATILHAVCVFGVVTPTGQLAEAHSLQPWDPNSEEAIRDAEAIDFSATRPAGERPEQHFVFVIEEFFSKR
jgi:hypothetical protein